MQRPWDQRDGEEDKSYTAFLAYVQLGYRRSLSKLAKQLGYDNPGQLKHWSAEFAWVERAAAYDRDPISRALEEQAQRRAEIEARKLRARLDLQERLLDRSDKLFDSLFNLAEDDTRAAVAQVRALEMAFEVAGLKDAPDEKDQDAAQGAVVDYLLKLMDALDPDDAVTFRGLIERAQEGRRDG